MAVDSGSYIERLHALLFPPRPRAAVPINVPVGTWPVPEVLNRPAWVALLGVGVAVTVGASPLSVPDLIARVRGLKVKELMDSARRILMDFHLSGYRGGTSRPVSLDPSWERELARLEAQPESVREEHHWVLSQPNDLHAQLWGNRVGGSSEVVLSSVFGLCDLVAPAVP